MNGSGKLPSSPRAEEPIDPQGSILSGTMPSPKTDVKKNLDFGTAEFRAVNHCCLFHHTFPTLVCGCKRRPV